MKGLQKFTALIVAALGTSLLVGCGGSNSSEKTSSVDNSSVTPSSSQDASSSTAPASSEQSSKSSTPSSVSSASPSSSSATPSSSVAPSSSSSQGHVHKTQFVPFVAATKTEYGVMDHYVCKECGELLDSEGKKVTQEQLKVEKLGEKSIFTQVYEHKSIFDAAIYTEKDHISKSMIQNEYVIGVDNEGVIIYAGRFGGGYGGPGDSFYNDGSYAWIAGQVCGIFDIYSNFVPWTPEATEVTWENFEVVVPEGGFIIAGDNLCMADLVCALLPGVDRATFLRETKNETFEVDTPVGKLNKDRLKLLDGDLYGQVSLERTISSGLFLTTPIATTKLTPAEDGTYTYDFSLAQWGKINLYTVDEKGLEKSIWFDNTKVSGAVTDESEYGADWTMKLYHEQNKDGYFYACLEAQYRLVYNPIENTLVFYTPNELIVNGAIEKVCCPTAEGAKYNVYGAFPQWGGVTLTKVTSDYKLVAINHENATFTGDVVNATDDPWDGKLYRDPANTNKYISGLDNAVYSIDVELGATDKVNVRRALAGVKLANTRDCTGTFEAQTDGTYVGTINFSKTYGKTQVIYTNDNGEDVVVFFDNTDISGDVNAADVYGDKGGGKIYHESGKNYFYAGTPNRYTFTYTPEKDGARAKLVITLFKGTVEVRDADGALSSVRNNVDGTYTIDISFTKSWGSFKLTFVDAAGNETQIWYNNALISGDVSDSATEGCAWDGNLYHEGSNKAFYCETSNSFSLTYTPEKDGGSASLKVAKYGIEFSNLSHCSHSVIQEEAGIFTISLSFDEAWGSFSLSYKDKNGSVKPIWYDNTTISGAITAADVIGCQWNGNLYHETEKVWWSENPNSYTLTYNAMNSTLVVAIANN